MDPTGFIDADGERIGYAVVRSARRTLAVCIGRDGAVTVRAPHRAPARDIARLVQDKALWVARKRAEVIARGGDVAPTPLGPAEMAEARRLLGQRLAACWAVFSPGGDEPPPLRVRQMRSRWGSLSPDGRVCLNARLVRAPLACIDYVVFHELCHLRVRGHGPDFYGQVARYVPAWREHRQALREVPL